jgi:hypothetical protein
MVNTNLEWAFEGAFEERGLRAENELMQRLPERATDDRTIGEVSSLIETTSKLAWSLMPKTEVPVEHVSMAVLQDFCGIGFCQCLLVRGRQRSHGFVR